jgi:hypothetical protein
MTFQPLSTGKILRQVKTHSPFPIVPRWNIGPSQIFASGLCFLSFVSPLSKTRFALVVLLRLSSSR